MRTATSRFVTSLNVFVLVGACLCGTLTGLIGYKHTKRINFNLNAVSGVVIIFPTAWKWYICYFQMKVDEELEVFSNQKTNKKRNLWMVIIVFFAITMLIILDGIAKWRVAARYRESSNILTFKIFTKNGF